MLRSPVRAAVAVAFIAVMAWTIQSVFRTTYFTIVAVLLVWGQVAGFFLPTSYELTDEKVTVRGLVSRREKEWRDFRSYHVDPHGLLLSPFIGRSRLERFRGVSLQFHGNREEVVDFVERQMAGRRDEGSGGDYAGEEQARPGHGAVDEEERFNTHDSLGDEGQGEGETAS